jgi:hypothetical protein
MFAQRTFFSANSLTIENEKILIRAQSLLFHLLAAYSFRTTAFFPQRDVATTRFKTEDRWPDAEPRRLNPRSVEAAFSGFLISAGIIALSIRYRIIRFATNRVARAQNTSRSIT